MNRIESQKIEDSHRFNSASQKIATSPGYHIQPKGIGFHIKINNMWMKHDETKKNESYCSKGLGNWGFGIKMSISKG